MECIIPTSCPRLYEAQEKNVIRRRPKLLFLAYRFPPVSSSSGSIRTKNIVKYLTRLGWNITVVTPHPSVWRYVDNLEEVDITLPRQGFRRIFTDHRWRCLIPDDLKCWNRGLGWVTGGACRVIARRLGIDRGIGWLRAAERACATLTPQDVDVIFATAWPFVSFKLAKRLSDRLRRPYVLDYRDPWTENPHASRPARLSTMQEEARLLARCTAATIVSPSWGLNLDRRFGLGTKLHVVTNGYDPEELAEVEPYNFGHFTIVYTGNFYPPKRVITPVMAALKRVKDAMAGQESRDWYFHYYGVHITHVREEAERFGVFDRVVLHGKVPRDTALSAVRGADIAVIITSVDRMVSLSDQGIVPGKVFETLGLGTPMLLITPVGSDVEAIAEPTGLAQSFTGANIEGMAAFLIAAMSGHTLAPKNSQLYAWPNIATKLDTVLRTVFLEHTGNKITYQM